MGAPPLLNSAQPSDWDGQNSFAPLGNHGKPLCVPLGPLSWGRISSIHRMVLKKVFVAPKGVLWVNGEKPACHPN